MNKNNTVLKILLTLALVAFSAVNYFTLKNNRAYFVFVIIYVIIMVIISDGKKDAQDDDGEEIEALSDEEMEDFILEDGEFSYEDYDEVCCPECGEYMGKDVLKCPSCGYNKGDEAPQFCEHCGKPKEEGLDFCPYCNKDYTN